MKSIKKENGAITLITLVTVLFMVSFLISAYILISNKVKTQKDIIDETREIYESKSTMEEVYNSYISEDKIIPIYNMEQLLDIGTGKTKIINNKYYTFLSNATYILMNDLEYSESLENTDENEETGRLLIGNSFKGKFDGNGHKITVINNAGEKCICSEENNFNGILEDIPEAYKDKVYNVIDGVYIPKGFKYVKGTKNTGIVITDDFSGEEDKGNEFVWVPVDGITLTFSKKAFNSETLKNKKTISTYWLDEDTNEYKSLESSVKEYKGFYIGRYETSKVPDSSTDIAQIKKGYSPWVNVKDEVYEISTNMYSAKPDYKKYITTHLIYPQEWDTTLNWIVQTGAKTEEEVAEDSTSWGIYGTLENTGSSQQVMANNIYDLAGNAAEITQELNDIDSKVSIRGGNQDITLKKNCNAGVREYTGSAQKYTGFRICMMINL